MVFRFSAAANIIEEFLSIDAFYAEIPKVIFKSRSLFVCEFHVRILRSYRSKEKSESAV